MAYDHYPIWLMHTVLIDHIYCHDWYDGMRSGWIATVGGDAFCICNIDDYGVSEDVFFASNCDTQIVHRIREDPSLVVRGNEAFSLIEKSHVVDLLDEPRRKMPTSLMAISASYRHAVIDTSVNMCDSESIHLAIIQIKDARNRLL